MKIVFHAAAFAAMPLLATVAHAQVTGGHVTLSHGAFFEDTSVNKTSLDGAVEFGINRNFSIQADLGFNNFNASGLDVTNVALHGIYHLSNEASLGAFVGIDRSGGSNADLIGLEFGRQIGTAGMEGYVGYAESGGIDGHIIGLSGRVDTSAGIGLGASLDHANVENVLKVTRFGVSADYDVMPTLRLNAEIGQLNARFAGLGGNEAYFKLGAKISFGTKRGATFGKRSLTNVVPGL